MLGWDLLHLVPRYDGEDQDSRYQGPTADSLHPSHRVLLEADLLVLEGNTLAPHPDTGHTCIETGLRFAIPPLRRRGPVWFLHYSGHEDSHGPMSDTHIRKEIEARQTQLKLQGQILFADSGQSMSFTSGPDPSASAPREAQLLSSGESRTRRDSRINAIERIKAFLNDLSEGSERSQAVDALAKLLPFEVRHKIGLRVVDQLVAARLAELHYSARTLEFAKELKEIESKRIANRGVWVTSYERDVDRAVDGREYARATIAQILERISGALESPA